MARSAGQLHGGRRRAARSSACSARRTSGDSDDYRTEKMPAVNVSLLDGQLAWRQHDGGHTDGPNWKYFIPWADKISQARAGVERERRRGSASVLATSAASALADDSGSDHLLTCGAIAPRAVAAARPGARAGRAAGAGAARTGRSGRAAHRSELDDRARAAAREGAHRAASTSTSTATPSRAAGARPTIRSFWPTGGRTSSAGTPPTSAGAPTGRRTSSGASRTASSTASIPKVIVLLAGTNNVGAQPRRRREGRGHHARPEGDLDMLPPEGADGDDHPDGHLPAQRQHGGDAGDRPDQREPGAPRRRQARSATSTSTTSSPTRDGRLFDGHDERADKLHPTLKGYQVWADGLKPIFTELLGPPAATDHAPPPTGDPSARPK